MEPVQEPGKRWPGGELTALGDPIAGTPDILSNGQQTDTAGSVEAVVPARRLAVVSGQ